MAESQSPSRKTDTASSDANKLSGAPANPTFNCSMSTIQYNCLRSPTPLEDGSLLTNGSKFRFARVTGFRCNQLLFVYIEYIFYNQVMESIKRLKLLI